MFGLHSPINRIGFSLFVAGIASTLVAMTWWGIDGGYGNYFSLTYDFDQRVYDGWQKLGRWSLLPIVIGAILAWGYRPTIGRWLAWIRRG